MRTERRRAHSRNLPKTRESNSNSHLLNKSRVVLSHVLLQSESAITRGCPLSSLSRKDGNSRTAEACAALESACKMRNRTQSRKMMHYCLFLRQLRWQTILSQVTLARQPNPNRHLQRKSRPDCDDRAEHWVRATCERRERKLREL